MILGLNEIFKKKEKVMKHEIDAVITNLEVALSSDYSPTGHFCSFVFIDERPAFPRVKRTLEELRINPDVHVVDHQYSWREITEKTDIKGLKITKH